jgi:uncharacterized protein involved in high-affinity Fe2+ transport
MNSITRQIVLFARLLIAACVVAEVAAAQSAEPKPKALASAADPLKQAALIGRVASGDMVFQLEIEGSEPMWMPMGTPARWGARTPAANARYHVELKLTDPKSKTRIPCASITFAATNQDTGKATSVVLPSMRGKTGLHYSGNSALLGNGTYSVTLTANTPTFQRELADDELRSKPVSAKFHFKLDCKLTEVSQPST